MSHPHLPVELLDHFVDSLQDSRDALKNCCLVSKSWIPRARKHLFAKIVFWDASHLGSWKSTFPDPFTSPACYTISLEICCPEAIAATDAEEGGWIQTFSRVVHLEVVIGRGYMDYHGLSLTPLHGFSPLITSLSVSFREVPFARVINLILSFPLLEDLYVCHFDFFADHSEYSPDKQPAIAQPLCPPPLTGSLTLHVSKGARPFAFPLLSLPSGLHFRKLDLTWDCEGDVSLTTALVEKCSPTLESLRIVANGDWSSPHSPNLSKATKLKDAEFRCDRDPRQITVMLRTITLNNGNLKRISVYLFRLLDDLIDTDPGHGIGGEIHTEWLELDRLLVQLWESRSICPRVLYTVPSHVDGERARNIMENLLPETTTRAIVDLVGKRKI